MPASANAPLLLPGYLSTPSARSVCAGAVALQQGVLTTIRVGPSDRPSTLADLLASSPHSSAPPSQRPARFSLRLNGQPDAPRWFSHLFSSFSAHLDDVPLRMEQTTTLPDLGAPLTTARALSLSLAINAWCQSPLSLQRCAHLATDALVHGGQPLGLGVHLSGGLLSFSPERVHPQSHLLSPAELRMPIRLSYFGPSSAPRRNARLQKSYSLLSNKAALQAAHLFNAKSSLLSLAAASRQFALQTHPPKFWAADLLSPRPLAGLVPNSKAIFEPGLHTCEPMVRPLTGPPPQTLLVHSTNEGAKVI